MEKLILSIDGMSCGHCLSAVRNALERVPGVRVEQVTIGQATVAYDPDRVTPSAIAGAIADEGYAATAA